MTSGLDFPVRKVTKVELFPCLHEIDDKRAENLASELLESTYAPQVPRCPECHQYITSYCINLEEHPPVQTAVDSVKGESDRVHANTKAKSSTEDDEGGASPFGLDVLSALFAALFSDSKNLSEQKA